MKQLIPIPTDLNIEKFTGAQIERMSSYIENGIIEEYPEGKKYVTQRPSFTTVSDASALGYSTRGRGIHRWRLANATYSVNYQTVYKDTTVCTKPAAAALELTASANRVYFAELGDDLGLLDVAGNKFWYSDDSTSTIFTEVAGEAFNSSKTLADGTAVLDNTLYLLANEDASTSAYIYGCDLLDMSAWTSTNFIVAYKNSDRGVYIGTHHNNIFVLGNESCEFFYNAGNPVPGSSLSARQDISYNIGCADGKSVFIDNDEVFFVGKSTTSGIGVFKLSNFQIQKISSPSLDSYLTTAIVNGGVSVMGSGLFAGGRTFYVLTLYENTSNTVIPAETIVFNTHSNTWTFWEHSATGIDEFPLVAFTKSNDVSGTYKTTGKGILSNGDIIECYDDFFPQDRTGGVLTFEALSDVADTGLAVFADDIWEDISALGDQIEMRVRVGHIDFDTRNRKFMQQLRPVCDQSEEAQTLYIKYADDNHEVFTLERELNLANANDKLTRLGQFRSRTFEIRYAGDELLRLNGLEVEVIGAGV